MDAADPGCLGCFELEGLCDAGDGDASAPKPSQGGTVLEAASSLDGTQLPVTPQSNDDTRAPPATTTCATPTPPPTTNITSQPTEGQAPPGSILFSVPVGVHASKNRGGKERKEMNKGQGAGCWWCGSNRFLAVETDVAAVSGRCPGQPFHHPRARRGGRNRPRTLIPSGLPSRPSPRLEVRAQSCRRAPSKPFCELDCVSGMDAQRAPTELARECRCVGGVRAGPSTMP